MMESEIEAVNILFVVRNILFNHYICRKKKRNNKIMKKDENKRDTSERDFGLMNITIGILFVAIAIFIGYVVVDYIKFALEH